MAETSRSQIDLLGIRLKLDRVTDDDLRLLDSIRRSYSTGYEEVIAVIRSELKLEPTGRPAKSTSSIREKLQRETIRLSQMQDIAGCRVIVADIAAQEMTVYDLRTLFPASIVIDRRAAPSYGYRAVHLIPTVHDVPIEIQVRTTLQHAWAELSEKWADVIDPRIKYGGGPDSFRDALDLWSNLVRRLEVLEERDPGAFPAEVAQLRADLRQDIEDLIDTLQELKEE